MQTPADILNKHDFRHPTQHGSSTSQSQAGSQTMFSTLNTLKSMKLLTLTDAKAYKVWEQGLSDLSDAELIRGTNSARDFTGYFSLPAFRELCKSVDASQYGLPDVRQAYEEACMKPSPKDRQKWSHPAVYHAGRLTGWHELRCMTTTEIFPRYQYHYEQLCKRVIAGENINIDVPQAIPQRISKVLTPAENQARMAALREATGL